MRRKDREVTDLSQLEEIIRQCDCIHLGLLDGDSPYVVPMNFGYERTGPAGDQRRASVLDSGTASGAGRNRGHRESAGAQRTVKQRFWGTAQAVPLFFLDTKKMIEPFYHFKAYEKQLGFILLRSNPPPQCNILY